MGLFSKADKTVLQKARDYLAASPDNWVRGTLGPVLLHGPNCAIGAIGRVKGVQLNSAAQGDREVAALAAAIPDCWRKEMERQGINDTATGTPVWSFNDAEGRTREDILALFDYAIRDEKMPSPEDN